MNKKEIEEILAKHLKWINNEQGGERYVCSSGADLSGADLSGADLSVADLSRANLSVADLSNADLSGANLSVADLSVADLSHANLSNANLSNADLRHADLSGADLSNADLSGADLSNAKGIMTAKTYLSQFETDKKGVLVYKAIGDTFFPLPDYWEIKAGKFLEEVVNPVRTVDCGSGVNFGTLDWINKNLPGKDIVVWQCRILWEDLADVVVPYNTDGKARCARLQLIKKVER